MKIALAAPTNFCAWQFRVGASATNMFLVNGYALAQTAGAIIGGNAPTGSTWSTAQPYGATLTANWWSLDGQVIDGQTVHNLDFVVIGTTTSAAVDMPIVGTAKCFRVVEAD